MTTLQSFSIHPHRVVSLEFTDKIIRLKLASGAQISIPNRGCTSLVNGNLETGFIADATDLADGVYPSGHAINLPAQTDAIAALQALGKSKAEAINRVNAAVNKLGYKANVEQLTALALQNREDNP